MISLNNVLKNLYKNKLVFFSICASSLLIIALIGVLFLVPSIFFSNNTKPGKTVKQTELGADNIKEEGNKEEIRDSGTIVLSGFFIPLRTGSASPDRFLKFDLQVVVKESSDHDLLHRDVAGLRKIVFQYLIMESIQNPATLQDKETLRQRLLMVINEQQKAAEIQSLIIKDFINN